MRLKGVPVLVGLFALLACNNETTHTPDENLANSRYLSVKSQLNTEKTSTLTTLLQNYFDLKNAFVDDDEQKVNTSAQYLIASCKTLNEQITTDTTFTLPYSQHIDSILTFSAKIIDTDDPSVELKRVPFKIISRSVHNLVTDYQLTGIQIYQQYCPLVFNDNGAHWLSSEKEIKNPYMGKKMVECGEVVDIIE